MAKWNKYIENIFGAKRKRRKALSRLPVEEKFQILLQLQKIAHPILQTRGISKTPWMTCQIFQVKPSRETRQEIIAAHIHDAGYCHVPTLFTPEKGRS